MLKSFCLRTTAVGIFIFVTALPEPVLANKGIPDLSGTHDVSTLTPLSRPKEFGNNLELTPEQASKIISDNQDRVANRSKSRGPVTEAPPSGGAPPIGIGDEFRESSGAGNVGGYNDFWVDPGSDVIQVNGTFRTSIITDPPNGRMLALTESAMERLIERRRLEGRTMEPLGG